MERNNTMTKWDYICNAPSPLKSINYNRILLYYLIRASNCTFEEWFIPGLAKHSRILWYALNFCLSFSFRWFPDPSIDLQQKLGMQSRWFFSQIFVAALDRGLCHLGRGHKTLLMDNVGHSGSGGGSILSPIPPSRLHRHATQTGTRQDKAPPPLHIFTLLTWLYRLWTMDMCFLVSIEKCRLKLFNGH